MKKAATYQKYKKQVDRCIQGGANLVDIVTELLEEKKRIMFDTRFQEDPEMITRIRARQTKQNCFQAIDLIVKELQEKKEDE